MRVLRGDKGRRRGKDDCQPGFYLGRHSCEDEKGLTGRMLPGGEEDGPRIFSPVRDSSGRGPAQERGPGEDFELPSISSVV